MGLVLSCQSNSVGERSKVTDMRYLSNSLNSQFSINIASRQKKVNVVQFKQLKVKMTTLLSIMMFTVLM